MSKPDSDAFKQAVANCDRALMKLGLGDLIDGNHIQNSDVPLIERSQPRFKPEPDKVGDITTLFDDVDRLDPDFGLGGTERL